LEMSVCGEILEIKNCPYWKKHILRDKVISALPNYHEVVDYYESNPKELNEYPTAGRFICLSNAYLYEKQYDKSIAALKRAIETDPKSYNAFINLGEAYKGKRQYDEAISAYKKAMTLNPNNTSSYTRLAQVYLDKGNYSEAINILKKALEIAPTDDKVLSTLANIYIKAGNYVEAVSILNTAIELRTITWIGISISIEGDYPVVKEVMEAGPAKKADMQIGDKIIKVDGEKTKGWDPEEVVKKIKGAEGTQVTLIIERKGMNKPFEKTITRERFMLKGAAPCLAMRSLIYAVKGEFDRASQDAKDAYSLNPGDSWAKSAISFAYIQEGKTDEALKILAASKDNFDRLLEALAYSKMGDLKKSMETYTSLPEEYLSSKDALRQQFKNAVLESLVPYVEDKKAHARSLEVKGKYRDAIKEYAELIKIADDKEAREIRGHVAILLKEKPYLKELPEEARRHALRAEVSTKDGKFEDAVEEYKEAIKIAPFFPDLYKAIALNYAGMKEYQRAIDNMNIYLELFLEASDARAAKDEIYKWEYAMQKQEGK